MQVEVVGLGTFSVVLKAVDLAARPPEVVALKVLSRGSTVRGLKPYLLREIVHQSRLKHPFLVPLKEVIIQKK